MKICFFADAGSVHSRRWIRWFAERGHDVTMVSTRPWGADLPDNIALHVLKARGNLVARRAAKALQIRRLVTRIRPDLVHGHYVSDGGLHAAISGIHPFVLTAWGSDILVEPKAKLMSRIVARFVLERADLITCDAEHMVGAIRDLAPREKRVVRINFGTDTERFRPGLRNESLRTALGAEPGTIVVISTRSLAPIYSVETLIRAVPIVAGRCENVKFVIAGDGPQKRELELLVGDLGVSSKVRFTGPLTGDAMPEHLAAADIYVSTSLSDAGLASSTAEAMSSELPVVITDFGDNGAWVSRDGEGGRLVPPAAPAALADAIRALIEDPALRRRCGETNRRVIEERSSYSREMAKMEALYEDVVRSGGRPT